MGLVPRPSAALDLEQQPFTVQTWERADGVNQLAQGPDGLIWIATRAGLTRFDGARFVDVAVDSGGLTADRTIRRVLAASDGAVWVASGSGLLEIVAEPEPRLFARHAQSTAVLSRTAPRPWGLPDAPFQPVPGLADAWVWAMIEEPGAGVWIGTEQGLFLVNGRRLERFTTASGLPANFVSALALGPDGALYVGTSAGVAVRRNGRFTTTAIRQPVLSVAADRAGRVWAGDHQQLLRLDPGGRVSAFPGEDAARDIAVDSEDVVWAGGVGVFAGGEPATLQRGTLRRAVNDVLVDREGSLWLGVREGALVAMSTPRIRNFDPGEGLPGLVAFSVLAARDGSVYASTQGGLARHDGRAWKVWKNSPQLSSGPRVLAESTHPASRGIWAGNDRLLRGGPHGFQPMWLARPEGTSEGELNSVVVTRAGDLWASHSSNGVLRFRGGDVSGTPDRISVDGGLCGPGLIHGLEAQDGSIWFASTYGQSRTGATRIKEGRARCYHRNDGLPDAQVGAVAEDADGAIWLGTGWPARLVRFRDERFSAVSAGSGLPIANINGLLDDRRGHLWICSEAGVWRVPLAELHRCADAPCPQVNATAYGKDDGMRTAECTGAFHPNMTLDQRGNVWVATLRGISVFAPAEGPARTLGRPIVEEIAVDGLPEDVVDPLVLGPGHSDLHVRYTLASFLEPRPALRHRLLGFDADWIPAGTSPIARYRDLPAGRYTLELQVGNDGAPITRLAVVARPPLWQTPWFLPLLVGAIVCAALLLHRSRVARLASRHRAITGERKRIARDLHDGLAQKLRTIGLLAERLRPAPSASPPDEVLANMRQIVGEAHADLRRAIWDIGQGSDEQRLETLIERVVSEAALPPRTRLTLRTTESCRRVSGLVAHETPLVVKEALQNVVRHAGARAVEVGVISDEDGLQVWVRDDGCGLPAEGIPADASGYGLISMHERARRLGGTLSVRSQPGQGTEIALSVPGPGQKEDDRESESRRG
jgi:ligand-binding sensor domain-containing protein/signal transduction histidine kinase